VVVGAPRGAEDPEDPSTVGVSTTTGPAGQSATELTLKEIARVWPVVLGKLGETAPALAATFEGARPVAFDEEGLKIGFPVDMNFNKKKAEAPERRDAVASAFEAIVGQALRPAYVMLDGEAEAEAPAGGVDEEELLARLKSEFDAEEVG
jgi:DNA polymerase III subunit tau-like protein